MDWLAQTWQGFIDWLYEIFLALMGWFQDVFLNIFELLMNGIVYIYGLLQPPEFLTNGMSSLFASLHPDILYFLSMSKLDTALAIYGAGVSFRLLRKLFTLGQW